MNKFFVYLLITFIISPLFACQKSQNKTKEIDKNSYINGFDLLQENPRNNTSVRITSPNAIINHLSNDINIFDSKIELSSKNARDISVISGNSTLDNSSNLIRVFNNVYMSLLESENYFIKTDSFNWYLDKSDIEMNNPLDINFDTTNIISSGGIYNTKTGILEINNNIFKRTILNQEGKEQYQIEIISDNAKWIKNENKVEFKSNNKQVETNINILGIK